MNMKIKKIKKIWEGIYFSFICNIPINVNKLRAIIGDQIDKIIGILPVLPKARDKSLK